MDFTPDQIREIMTQRGLNVRGLAWELNAEDRRIRHILNPNINKRRRLRPEESRRLQELRDGAPLKPRQNNLPDKARIGNMSQARIRRILAITNWSANELAREIGVGTKQVKRWIDGSSTPNANNTRRLVELENRLLRR